MKKTAVLASMFAIIISGIYCTKADETLKNDKVEVSYAKAPSTSDESDPSVFADHLIRMENIQFGSNSLSMLSKVAEWRNAQAKYGNLVSGVRYSYNHSPVQVTEIPISSGPIKGSKESVLVYSYNGNAMVAVMKVSTFNELTTYAVTDVNGEAYYSITLNTANQIKGWSLLRDFQKNNFPCLRGQREFLLQVDQLAHNYIRIVSQAVFVVQSTSVRTIYSVPLLVEYGQLPV